MKIKQPKSAVSQRQYEAKGEKYWFVEDKTPHLGEFLLLYYWKLLNLKSNLKIDEKYTV